MKQRALDQLLAHHANAREQVARLVASGSSLPTNERTLELCFMDLKGLSFAGHTVRNVDLRGADLRGASFAGATIEHVLLPLARLDDADFSDARMSQVSFRSSDVQRANFTGATVEKCYIRDTRFRRASFDRAMIADSTIHESRMNDSHFVGATLRNVTLRDAGLTGSMFPEAIFDRVNAAGTRFLRCGFTDARLLEFRAGPRAPAQSLADTPQSAAPALTLNSGPDGRRLQRFRANLSELRAAGIVTGSTSAPESAVDDVTIERAQLLATSREPDVATTLPARFKECDFIRTQFEQCDLSRVLAADSHFDVCSLIASSPFADFKHGIDGVLVLRSAPTPAHITLASEAVLAAPSLARLGSISTFRLHS